jgi:NAD(P)-dependent dehydrogenase (short-subunit alcohol dehydrogenase family)
MLDAAVMLSEVPNLTCIVTGASSGIGLAAVRLLLDGEIGGLSVGRVHALARGARDSVELEMLATQHGDRLCRWKVDLTRPAELADFAAALQLSGDRPALVFNAAGLLHGPDLQPEKSVSQIRLDSLQSVFAINAFAPILLAQALLPLLRVRGPVVFASVSARVGSIGDNRLGGWYAYRASKAAQNQLVRTLAIELRRLRGRGRNRNRNRERHRVWRPTTSRVLGSHQQRRQGSTRRTRPDRGDADNAGAWLQGSRGGSRIRRAKGSIPIPIPTPTPR